MALRDSTRIKGGADVKMFTPPEMALWASVLELALNDYVTGIVTGSFTDEFRSAKEWIFGENQTASNSFETVCLVFNLNPDLTRKALQKDPLNIKLRLAGKSKKREYHVR